MNTMITLIRRELWESPVAFKWTPIGIGALFLLLTIFALLFARELDPQSAFTLDIIRWSAESDTAARREVITTALLGITAVFNMILFWVVVFYLASSLYDDRKDRSILFWKSLPVSDTQTVLSKLLTACLLVPLCFFLAIAATHIVMLTIASGYALVAGVNPVTTFWLPASLPRIWSLLLLAYLVQALWLLPVYGWLLFCSSWAPRLPFLIALGVPVLLGLFQNFHSLISTFRLPEFNIWTQFIGRVVYGVLPMSFNIQIDGSMNMNLFDRLVSFDALGERLLSANLWLGVAAGALFVATAIWFRKRATDQ